MHLTASLLKPECEQISGEAVDALAALRQAIKLIDAMRTNDPNEPVSDAGHIALDLWTYEADKLDILCKQLEQSARALKEAEAMGHQHYNAVSLDHEIKAAALAATVKEEEPVDELPESMTKEAYNVLFPYSKVDGVRLFPVFGPALKVQS